MSTNEGDFRPEALEQQTTPTSPGLSPQASHLVQSIYAASHAYAQHNEQSLASIWQRLQELAQLSEKQEPTLQDALPVENDSSEILTHADGAGLPVVSQRTPDEVLVGRAPTLRSIRLPAPPSRNGFTLVAALLVALILSGTLLTLVTKASLPGRGPSQIARGASTPTPVFLPFPVQQCPQPGGLPVGPWQPLCQAGEFVTLNQHIALAGSGAEVIIEAGYADSNALYLFYRISGSGVSVNLLTLKVIAHVQARQVVLPLITFPAVESTRWPLPLSYDTSNVPHNLQTLSLQVELPEDQPLGTPSTDRRGGSTMLFQVPWHGGQILRPRQTVTVNGESLTLSSVTLATHSVHFAFAFAPSPISGLSLLSLHINQRRIPLPGWAEISQAEEVSFFLGLDLSAEHGPCVLVLGQDNQQTWTFHFALP